MSEPSTPGKSIPTPPESSPVQWLLGQLSDHAEGPMPYLGYASDVLAPLLGWQRGQVRERLMRALAETQNSAILAAQMARQERGAFDPYSLVLPHQDGAPVTVLVCPRPVLLPDGQEIVTVTLAPAPMDISHQRAAFAEQTRLRSLLDRLPAFIALMDEEHSLHYANRVYKELFGDEGLGVHRNPAHFPYPAADVFEAGSLAIHEWTQETTGNVYRLYSYPFDDMDGGRLALVMGSDITQGKRAQDALALSEERYRSITDNLAVGIAIISVDRVITAANPLFRMWFGNGGGNDHKFCDSVFSDCLLEDQPVDCARLGTFHDGQVHDYELVQPEAGIDGTAKIFRLTTCPICDADGEVRDVIALLEDVTERKKVTERLQRARKLEAMGTLAAGIAHEINQPLSALQLYASGLEMLVEQQHSLAPETLLSRLGFILREADKIREIIEHMRTLVMQEDAPPVREVLVNDAIEAALSLVGAQLTAHGIRLDLQLGDSLPAVRANDVQLEQVVINLVINAMHALDSIEKQDKQIRILTHSPDGTSVQLDVADNGPGLQGLENRIFDPFFTTKEAGAGMGLGLAIVHSFVESWGGEITTATGLGERTATEQGGTTFSVMLHSAAGDAHAHIDS